MFIWIAFDSTSIPNLNFYSWWNKSIA